MSQNLNDMDITSANATAVLVAEGVFGGVILQGFSTDQSVVQGEATLAETRMGVDGQLAAGWIPSIRTVTIMFEANSSSIASIEEIIDVQNRLKRPVKITLVCTVPSVGKEYTYSMGVLKTATDGPQAKKVLDPNTYTFEFGRLDRFSI